MRSRPRVKRRLALRPTLSLEITSSALKRRQPAINNCTSGGNRVVPSRAAVCRRFESGNRNPSGLGRGSLGLRGALGRAAVPRRACNFSGAVSMAIITGPHGEMTEIFFTSRDGIRRPVSAVLSGHGFFSSIFALFHTVAAGRRNGQTPALARRTVAGLHLAGGVRGAGGRRDSTAGRSGPGHRIAIHATALSAVCGISHAMTAVYNRPAKASLKGGAKGHQRAAAI